LMSLVFMKLLEVTRIWQDLINGAVSGPAVFTKGQKFAT